MSSDVAVKRRAKQFRKTHPKSRTISLKKAEHNETGISPARIMRKTKYRSMFEIGIAKYLSQRKIGFEYEKKRLPYIPKPRVYTPDFYLIDQDIYIEAKGHFDKGDRVKMLLIKQQYPDLDIRIVFLNSKNKIYRGSKTTYSMWATKYGFPWAEGAIPEEWFKNDNG
jgi:hypothetical protein